MHNRIKKVFSSIIVNFKRQQNNLVNIINNKTTQLKKLIFREFVKTFEQNWLL